MMPPSVRQLPVWTSALVLVAAVHMALGALVFGWNSPVNESVPAIAIELAALPLIPAAPAAAPAAPAKPAPAVAKPAPAKAPPKPAPQKTSVVKAPKPRASPPAQQTAQPVAVSMPAVAAAPATGKRESKPNGQAAITWQQRLLTHLARYKRYPEPARRRSVQGTNALKLVIDGSGRVEHFALASTSGSDWLDHATLQMIRRAQPLPAPPAELLEDGRVEVVAPVSYTLDKR